MSAGRGARRAAIGTLVVLGAVVALWSANDGAGPRERRFALSPQECNTECQSRQTDCIDDCDGNAACERRCTAAGLRCVARCAPQGPDAGATGGAGGGGGAGGRAGASGSAGAGRGGSSASGNAGQAGAR